MSALSDRLQQPDVANLPDWEAANILNSPDESIPVVVEWLPTQIGLGTVMAALGAEPGAMFLSQIETLGSTVPTMKWGLEVLRSGSFNLALPVARQTVDGLVQAGLITSGQRDQFFSVSRRERHPSWSEANGVKVDARSVGLARGAKP